MSYDTIMMPCQVLLCHMPHCLGKWSRFPCTAWKTEWRGCTLALTNADLTPLKQEAWHSCPEGRLDAQQLLGHYRQNLYVNAVELIKASPSAALGQPTEELALQVGSKGIQS